MKNTFKLGFLAMAITLVVTACSSSQKATEGSDSASLDSTVMPADTSSADTTSTDTAATDTTQNL